MIQLNYEWVAVLETTKKTVIEKFYVTDHVDNRSTPWLVIHSSKDCRLGLTRSMRYGNVHIFHTVV
jgi:hypothetical protein